jgi:hypothetical protein
MGWIWIVAAGWMLLGVALALLISRSVALADRKAAEEAATVARGRGLLDADVDRDPPLRLAPPPPPPPAPAPAKEPAAGTEPAAAPTRRDPTTIPGLPSARPPVGRPPVPKSTRKAPHRRSGLG